MKGSSTIVVSHIQPIINYEARNEAHVDELINVKLKELWYTGKGEVALYSSTPQSQWHEEAKVLGQWISDCYSYLESNKTMQDFQGFTSGLPELILP
jgi:hypothetical protein